MAKNGLTIFVLFFGIALLDAVGGGQWWQVAFWIAIGLAFVILGRMRRGRGPASGPSPRH